MDRNRGQKERKSYPKKLEERKREREKIKIKITEQTKWPSNKQTKAVSGQLVGVGRVHLLSGDHCIRLSVCSPTCPATSHTALSHFNRAFMASLSAASKAVRPSGPFRSLSAPCGGEGTWILTMLGGRITSSSQRDANFKSEVEVKSRWSGASFESEAETGKRQWITFICFQCRWRSDQVETLFEFKLEWS